jgi:hypothetical protein
MLLKYDFIYLNEQEVILIIEVLAVNKELYII